MQIKKLKSLFDTRWVERQAVFEDFHILYEPLLKTFDEIRSNRGWDTEAANQAHGLATNIQLRVYCSLSSVQLPLLVSPKV